MKVRPQIQTVSELDGTTTRTDVDNGAWQFEAFHFECCHLLRNVSCHILYSGCWAATYRCALRINHSSPAITYLPFSTGSHAMSAVPSTSNFASIFNAALETYNRKTKQDLANHPLLPRLQSCDSLEAVLAVLREQTPNFNQPPNRDESNDGLSEWIAPTVNVLYSFSATLGGVVGLVNIIICFFAILSNLMLTFQAFPPANIIFTGISVLLLVGVCHSFCANDFDILTLRLLKMPALAEAKSSTCLTASKDSSNGLKFTPA